MAEHSQSHRRKHAPGETVSYAFNDGKHMNHCGEDSSLILLTSVVYFEVASLFFLLDLIFNLLLNSPQVMHGLLDYCHRILSYKL